jgi:hypothetical protein
MTKADSRLTKLETDKDWHFKIGRWLFGGGFSALAALAIAVFWYGPEYVRTEITESQSGINTRLDDVGKQLGAITTELAVLRDRTNRFIADMATTGPDARTKVSIAMKEAISTNNPQAGLATIAAVAQAATERQVETDPSVVAKVGEQVLAIGRNSAESQAAWNAALDLAAYRSFLNRAFVPRIPPDPPVSDSQRTQWITRIPLEVFGRVGQAVPRPVMDFYGISSTPTLYEPIARPARFGEIGPALMVIRGQLHPDVRIPLDGFRLRNIVVRDMNVAWMGGPTALENVAFVNCRFQFERNEPGSERLVRELLANERVTFTEQG